MTAAEVSENSTDQIFSFLKVRKKNSSTVSAQV